MLLKKILMIVACLSVNVSVAANTMQTHPTLLLVHGALLTSGIWAPVQSYLQNHHYNVVTVDIPGRAEDDISAKEATLYQAAKKVCDVARMQYGPVILVGHSQGGAVINQAINECETKIKALIYVAAVVPLNGEKPYQLLSEEDNEHFDSCTQLDEKSGLYKINYNGPLKEMFMADASLEQVQHATANMVPEPIIIGENLLHFPEDTFEKIPKFYIETTEDKIISPKTQQRMRSRIHFIHSYSLQSSHSPFISKSKQLSRLLMGIADHYTIDD
ncbi:acetoin dehydrogenase E2 subunit dihydrolipoyllysine-residue acetyltransferase [Legionella beliardensis]|uniref:Acetoin dehydrogenase E2 subunit dihydrolipoyllysine-residue acetyltransferase n=1 Tax=Legionella beliardensis TaxID=91822 RepID=A0A378I2G7_9GAMM|nr:alpha/beta fold hydrolase [Legionella beliardensis]STX29183.1 acetoin dehydrogenase E2 subunit dihydrolipoyllysine-residue acetyltransferase [Legionella beliardensis]